MESSSSDGGPPHQFLASVAPTSVDGSAWFFLIIIIFLLFLGLWLLAVAKAMRRMYWDYPKNRERTLTSLNLAGALFIALGLVMRYNYFPLLFGSSLLSFLVEVLLMMFLGVFVDQFFALRITYKANSPNALMTFIAGLSVRFLGPLAQLPTAIAVAVDKRLGGSDTGFELTDDTMDVAENSTTNKEELNLEESYIRFGDRQVRQIMKPRGDVIGVEENLEYLDMMNEVRNAGYSRIPVYREDLDNVVGILYVKDLLNFLDKDNSFHWQTLIRKPLFIPETIKIDSLLREMKRTRVHIALTVDEYGSTAGLVTLEDIMEEVMGEIRDEYDDGKEVEFEKVDENTYLFEGKTHLSDMCRILGLENDTFDEVKGDTDSIAGLILQLIGQLPEEGEEVSYEQYLFKVEAVGMNRIEKVRLTINPEGVKQSQTNH